LKIGKEETLNNFMRNIIKIRNKSRVNTKLSRDRFSPEQKKYSETEMNDIKRTKKDKKQVIDKPFQLILLFQIILILISIVFLFISGYVYFIESSYQGWLNPNRWSSDHYAVIIVRLKLLNLYAAFINTLFIIYGIELKKLPLQILLYVNLFFIALNLIALTTPFYDILALYTIIAEIKIHIDTFILFVLAISFYKQIYRGHTRITLLILILIFLNINFLTTYLF
jgi:hypothetical protein